jgi:hypothetical protein
MPKPMRVYYRSRKPGGNQLHRIDVECINGAGAKEAMQEVQDFLTSNKLKFFGAVLAVVK